MKQCYQFNNDNEWYTYESDVENFLSNVDIPKDKVIWCPFDLNESNFVKVFKSHGYRVLNTHIDYGQDFFNYEPTEHYDMIISNPPFRDKAKFLKRMNELKKPFAMIYGIQCFNSGGFVRELKNVKNLQFILLTKRMKFFKDLNENSFRNFKNTPTFHSMWICNDFLDSKIKIIDEKKNRKEKGGD